MTDKKMVADLAFRQTIDGFIRRNYKTCAQEARAALSPAFRLEAAQLLLISLERLGRLQEARDQGHALIAACPDAWDRILLELTLGEIAADRVFALIPEKTDENAAKQLWQLNYYVGALLISAHELDEAIKVFRTIMLSGVTPVASFELYLMGIENNFLTTGSSGTDVDKSVIELNLQTEQLYKQKKNESARGLATRAYELARQSLGEYHPAFIAAVHNLASINAVLGNYDQAEPFYIYLVDLQRAAYGPDNSQLKEALSMLEAVRKRRGNTSAKS